MDYTLEYRNLKRKRITCRIIVSTVHFFLYREMRHIRDQHDMKNTSTLKNKELSVLEMFFLPIILGTIATFCSLLMTNGHALDRTIYLQGDNRFMDFFNHIVYARDLYSTYSTTFHACFPPLAYLFYHLLSLLLPEDTYVVSHATTMYGSVFVLGKTASHTLEALFAPCSMYGFCSFVEWRIYANLFCNSSFIFLKLYKRKFQSYGLLLWAGIRYALFSCHHTI